MSNQKINVSYDIQPCHDGNRTELHDGKMYIKVGPHNERVKVIFVAHGIQSVSDKLKFDDIEDAYSYYNHKWNEEN